MTIHQQILDQLNLQPGDIVKITHKVPRENLGWDNSWVGEMDDAIGNEYTVRTTSNTGVYFKEISNGFPAQCIEFIRKANKSIIIDNLTEEYSAEVLPANMIKVGCQTVTREKFKELYQATQKLWK